MTIINKQMDDRFAKHKKEIIKILDDMNGKAHSKINEMLNINRKLTEDVANALMEQFKSLDKQTDVKIDENNEHIINKVVEILNEKDEQISHNVNKMLQAQVDFFNNEMKTNNEKIIQKVSELMTETINKMINNKEI